MKLCKTVALLFMSVPLVFLDAYARLPVVTQGPLLTALQHGDVEAVHHLEQELKVGPLTRDMDDAQLYYDIPRLLRGAEQCEVRDFKFGDLGGLVGALRCNKIARASALVLGNANEYLKQAFWARSVLLPALAKVFKQPKLAKEFPYEISFDSGLDTADLSGLQERTPVVTTTWNSSAQTLPFQNMSSVINTHAAPGLLVKINGHSETASLVTRSFTNAPISIIESPSGKDTLSNTLGLLPLVKNSNTSTATYRSHQYTVEAGLFLASTVEFGPLTLNHVAVVVLKSDYLPPGVYVGIPLLRQFGEVAVNRDHVLVAKKSGNRCKQPTPLVFASGENQDGVLMFPVSLDGIATKATFDSNAGGLLEVSPQMAASLPLGASEAQDGGSATMAPVAMKIGSWILRHKAYVPSNWNLPYQVTIGNLVLQDATVHLQFGAPSASICFSSDTTRTRD